MGCWVQHSVVEELGQSAPRWGLGVQGFIQGKQQVTLGLGLLCSHRALARIALSFVTFNSKRCFLPRVGSGLVLR